MQAVLLRRVDCQLLLLGPFAELHAVLFENAAGVCAAGCD